MPRPAKPTQLKVLHGDRKDRINRAEPLPAMGEVAPPWKLSKAGQAVWDRLAPDRIDKGVLTPWDVDAFAAFCEGLAVLPSIVKRAGRPQEKPGITSPMRVLKDHVQVLSTLGSRFGWTPADRAKLTIGEERRGPKEDLLSG
ncbi:MAG: P27 family phage terminase small subunit [Actinomycetota bacterium]|nr:P27 family phage terminase small subunit [Actinomycetota bacterium]